MSFYFIAQIKIQDFEEYNKYLKETDEVFNKFDGKYLAVDPSPQVLEGSWAYDRIVIIQFPNKIKFEQWYTSPEYQKILKYRLNAAQCDSLLVKGLTADL